MTAMPRWCGVTTALSLAWLAAGSLPTRAQEELPLSGPAYRIATEAYDAFGRHDYATAIADAREAIRQRPDVGRLRILLVRALAAAGQGEEARREAQSSASDPLLTPAAQTQLRQLAATVDLAPLPAQPDPAYLAAGAAYEAYHRRDYDLAVTKAREATDLAPAVESYRKLLANALAAQHLAARQREMTRTVRLTSLPSAAGNQAANAAYAAIRRHSYADALNQAREAVRAAPDNRDFRLLLIETLIRNGRQADALAETKKAINRFGQSADLLRQQGVLEAAAGDQPGAYRDLKAALQLSPSGGDTRFLRLSLADAALATSHPEDALDTLAPLGTAPDYDVWVRRGRALQAMRDYSGAEQAFAEAQRDAQGPGERDTVIAARIGLLTAEGRQAEARRLFVSSRRSGALQTLSAVDLGYLATQAGDACAANMAFETAWQSGELRGGQLIDAAYAARRAYDNEEAVSLFKQAIDSEERGDFTLPPQSLYGLRREVADLTRQWGAYATLSYGSSGISDAASLPANSSDHILQLGSEIYWRPPYIGYRNGTIFELFIRNFMTLADSQHGPTGFSTLQGSVGARWKPLEDYNLVLEASKLYKIGTNSRDDTLLRAMISGGFGGTDLRWDVPSWWTGQYFAEAGRYMQSGENIADGEVRFGRSYRMDSISDHLVLTPFLGVAPSYDSNYSTAFALGAGPGIDARYWFREDKYTAPMSYVDFTLQYRFGLVGGDRAQGIFAGINFAY